MRALRLSDCSASPSRTRRGRPKGPRLTRRAMRADVAADPSLDPLRYGLRALEEMAREEASVPPPPRASGDGFAPHPVLRPVRDGAALSLRVFTDAGDDATALVLGDATSLRLAPIPARAAPLFDAHAAAKASGADGALILGFPLVTFVQQGSARVAPLFSRDARARWTVGEAAWRLPPGARGGAPLPIPDGLVLELVDDAGEYALHGGVWHALFGADGSALGTIAAAAARGGAAALVRMATRVLDAGEGEVDDAELGSGPLTRDELSLLCEAAARRGRPGRGLRCYPHGLAMLPARGDPTSNLRSDLRALLDEPVPARGPLAVYLGAPAAPPRDGPVWASGAASPTPSQLAAARALEGTKDLVAVCGPPGCGKTALLHHVAAHVVVACALGDLWTTMPPRTAAWPLVVTSTNNAAVDHALSPFVGAPAIPLGLRVGSRRTLAEATGDALEAALEALEARGDATLADARAAFEARAKPVRELLREEATKRGAKRARAGAALGRAEAQPPDPALYEAALVVRDAWARAHRTTLASRLTTALKAARDERSGPGKPLSQALHELAPLYPIAGSTLLSMRTAFPFARGVIDRVVIDEAAQCAPIYAVPALARARRAMFTGDTAQLPPVYTLDPRVDDRIARGLDEARVAPFRMSATSTSSAQAAAEPRSRARLALVEHFRSQPAIVALASRWSGYALDVRTPERSLAHLSPRLSSAVLTIPVRGHGARAHEGVVNEAEAGVAVDLVETLLADGVREADIAVLTPFVGQSIRIERGLLARGVLARGGVLVSTVHRLQGGERRVVIFSVTATERRHLRWLGERPHLLHVATSRAQDHLVVLLDPEAPRLEPALAPLREALGPTPWELGAP